jgi:putative membrane-bound dehydrogenase-like protein
MSACVARSVRLAIPLASLFLLLRSVLAQPTPDDGTELLPTFTLPEGFTVELAAGPPLVERPITADFDEQGRLYVSDSSGTNDKVQKQLEDKPHRILRLEDTDGDGRFDKSIVFAEGLMFPEGTMWYDGSLYVSAVPSIWKLTDTDGDGTADKREEWFQGKTMTGCANDLHGPYLGPDGWIYWAKGAFAEQTHIIDTNPKRERGTKEWKTKASHLFRCRPDGSHLEPVMTGGMDNPVDVVFTKDGDRIFTTTFFVHPGGGLRDGLIHAVYGGVYGKEHGVLDGHPRTGELMPVLSHLGPAAPCGLAIYESQAFGKAYKQNLFACNFNLHRVTRHELTKKGGSYESKDSEFVVSSNLDFHPTDILADADGSLLIVDTGGWYKLCCPSSQLWKPDIRGGIYRVRKKDARQEDDPRGLTLAWKEAREAELVIRLGDPRPAIRQRAARELATRGESAIQPTIVGIRRGLSDELTRSAFWTLARIDSDAARAAVRQEITLSHGECDVAALQAVSLWRDKEALTLLLELLPQRKNCTVIAEALGRIGDSAAVAPLLAELAEPRDRAMEHALIYALIEIGDADATRQGLKSSSVHTRRAALIALDQMENGGLKPDDVVPLLDAEDEKLKETALWVVGHHAEWGSALDGYLAQRLKSGPTVDVEREALANLLARFAKHPTVQELLAKSLADNGLPTASRRACAAAMASAGLKDPPPTAWLDALAAAAASQPDALSADAVAAVRQLLNAKAKHAGLSTELENLARDSSRPLELRLTALAAIPGGLTAVDEPLWYLLQEGLKQSVAARAAAADVISAATLSADQLRDLLAHVETAGPLEVDKLLAAYEKQPDEALGLALVATLKKSPSLTSLRIDLIKTHLAKFNPAVHAAAEELFALINTDIASQSQRLEEMLPKMAGGDIRRGQQVFHSTKAVCNACHAVGYVGGKAGPDLTRIAQIRNERDLLESILFPSASLVRSYEPILVLTTDGRQLNGVIKNETSDEIVLVTGPNKEERIARSEIEATKPSTVSVMPAGLDKQLSEQELADLIAFLKSLK